MGTLWGFPSPTERLLIVNAYVKLEDSTGCEGERPAKMFFLLQKNVAGL